MCDLSPETSLKLALLIIYFTIFCKKILSSSSATSWRQINFGNNNALQKKKCFCNFLVFAEFMQKKLHLIVKNHLTVEQS